MVSTYRRLGHVRQTLGALARNELAAESTLYITSDGPMPGHEEEVFAVRRHLERLEGFGRVELRFFDKNDRTQIWNQRREISRAHGRYIYLEEDCVPAPTFLRFINDGLVRWAGDPSVFSIGGFSPPVPGLRTAEFMHHRVPSYNAWGFGTWERCDRLVRSSLSVAEYHELLRSRSLRRRIHRSVGILHLGLLRKVALGQLYAYDVMAQLEIVRRGMVCIIPSESFIQNIGFDGTGEHCAASDLHRVDHCTRPGGCWLGLEPRESEEVKRAFARYFGGTFRNLLRFHSKWLRGKMSAGR
jgi:hypothetical protein